MLCKEHRYQYFSQIIEYTPALIQSPFQRLILLLSNKEPIPLGKIGSKPAVSTVHSVVTISRFLTIVIELECMSTIKAEGGFSGLGLLFCPGHWAFGHH